MLLSYYYCRNDAIQLNKKSIADLPAIVKPKKRKDHPIHKFFQKWKKSARFPLTKPKWDGKIVYEEKENNLSNSLNRHNGHSIVVPFFHHNRRKKVICIVLYHFVP